MDLYQGRYYVFKIFSANGKNKVKRDTTKVNDSETTDSSCTSKRRK